MLQIIEIAVLYFKVQAGILVFMLQRTYWPMLMSLFSRLAWQAMGGT
jgi:hypothetical protein